jgi:hypothetical protein
VAGFVVFAGGLEDGVDAVAFVFGVVKMELFGSERAKAKSKPAPSES